MFYVYTVEIDATIDYFKRLIGLGCSLLAEHLSSKDEALDSVPSTKKNLIYEIRTSDIQIVPN